MQNAVNALPHLPPSCLPRHTLSGWVWDNVVYAVEGVGLMAAGWGSSSAEAPSALEAISGMKAEVIMQVAAVAAVAGA